MDWPTRLSAASRAGTFAHAYREYSKSTPYRRLLRALHRATGNRCQRCQTPDPPRRVLHHVHFRTLGREALHDVRLVCAPCADALGRPGCREVVPWCPAQAASARAAREASSTTAPQRSVRRRPPTQCPPAEAGGHCADAAAAASVRQDEPV
jgi:hypothetical protein